MLVINKNIRQKKSSANIHRLKNDFAKFDPQTGIWNWVAADNRHHHQVGDWNIALILATEVLRVAEIFSKGLDSPGIEELFTLAKETSVDPNKGFRTIKCLLGKLHNLGIGLSLTEESVHGVFTYAQLNKIVCWIKLALDGKSPTWLKEFKNSWISNGDDVILYCKNVLTDKTRELQAYPKFNPVFQDQAVLDMVVFADQEIRVSYDDYYVRFTQGEVDTKGILVRNLHWVFKDSQWLIQ